MNNQDAQSDGDKFDDNSQDDNEKYFDPFMPRATVKGQSLKQVVPLQTNSGEDKNEPAQTNKEKHNTVTPGPFDKPTDFQPEATLDHQDQIDLSKKKGGLEMEQ